MSDERNEIAELQREWRNSVTSSIAALEAKVDLMLAQMSDIRMEYARINHVEQLAERVSQLENDKAKIIGAAVLLNMVGGVVLWVLTKFWK